MTKYEMFQIRNISDLFKRTLLFSHNSNPSCIAETRIKQFILKITTHIPWFWILASKYNLGWLLWELEFTRGFFSGKHKFRSLTIVWDSCIFEYEMVEQTLNTLCIWIASHHSLNVFSYADFLNLFSVRS